MKTGIVAAIAVAAVAAVLVQTNWLSVVQLPVADALLRTAAEWKKSPDPPAGYPDVAVVAIDAFSLRAAEGEGDAWPWSRQRYAKLIEELDRAGAKVIAFDVDFSEQQDRQGDMQLAKAIKKSGRIVLGANRDEQALPSGLGFERGNVPLEEFAVAATAIGAGLTGLSEDGAIREAFRQRNIAGRPMLTLPEAAVSIALGEELLLDSEGSFLIDYRRKYPSVPILPFADVLQGNYERRHVVGRIVLVGGTVDILEDLHPTPLGGRLPGVYIQALAARGLIAERAGQNTLRNTSPTTQILLAALLSILAAAIPTSSSLRRLAGLSGLALGTLFVSLLVVTLSGVLLDLVIPSLVIVAHTILASEIVQGRLGHRLAERERSLSTLFSVGELTSHPVINNGFDLALALLGDVVGASGVAVLRTKPDGTLDSDQLVWPRDSEHKVGDLETAAEVLAARETRVFRGKIPGDGSRVGVAVYTPLIPGDKSLGVLIVECDDANTEPLDETQLRTVSTVGAQLGLSLDNLRLLDDLKDTFNAAVEAIASAVEARDGYTDLHCQRLAAFAVSMAYELGLPDDEVEGIRLGALLHDVGKIGVRDEILLKPGGLTPDERREIEAHPEIGSRIIAPIRGLPPSAIDCVRHHHERWDGTGYPEGLAAESIPLAARILALVDVWDALSSVRPYKEAIPQARVRSIIEKDSGRRFDPSLVDLFFHILEEQGEEMIALIETETKAEA